MRKSLDDAIYDREIQRMSNLSGFPHLPAAQLEYRRVLRRISETDSGFLHRLISDVIDTAAVCPTPAELTRFAETKRHASQMVAKGDCEVCHGSGFVTVTCQVHVSGLTPYESEFAAPCRCRGGK